MSLNSVFDKMCAVNERNHGGPWWSCELFVISIRFTWTFLNYSIYSYKISIPNKACLPSPFFPLS